MQLELRNVPSLQPLSDIYCHNKDLYMDGVKIAECHIDDTNGCTYIQIVNEAKYMEYQDFVENLPPINLLPF